MVDIKIYNSCLRKYFCAILLYRLILLQQRFASGISQKFDLLMLNLSCNFTQTLL